MKSNWWYRRSWIQTFASASGLMIGHGVAGSWLRALAETEMASERILVVIQLSGGNDGLNTIVPYRNESYRKARPKLAIDGKDVLRIDDELGFHPSLGGVSKLLEEGRFSVIQGVGYPTPNRSHFESMDIWHTCKRKEDRKSEGWLGRCANAMSLDPSRSNDLTQDSFGLHLGNEAQPLAMACRNVQMPSVASLEQFRLRVSGAESLQMETSRNSNRGQKSEDSDNADPLVGFIQSSTDAALLASSRLEKAMNSPEASNDFPASDLAKKLRIISRFILSGLGTKVYYVTLDGFDTHARQAMAHAGLLRQWSEAVSAFVEQMKRYGQSERVLVMTFSEFGRRVAENASEGTDHGAAAPMFLAGPKLANRLVGANPQFEKLDDGDLPYAIDFRSIYASVIQDWLKLESPPILGATYPTFPLF